MIKIPVELDGEQNTVDLEYVDVQFLACLSKFTGKEFSPKKTYSLMAKDVSERFGIDISSAYEIANEAVHTFVGLAFIFKEDGKEQFSKFMLRCMLRPPENEDDVIAEFMFSEQGCRCLPMMVNAAIDALKEKQS